jgi:two-component system response regulator NreC
VRVLLLDDHAVVRAGLRTLLGHSDAEIEFEEAASLEAALAIRQAPDVIVADLVLGDAQGPQITTALRAKFPDAPVLVLTLIDSLPTVDAVLAAGAAGYLVKDTAADEVVLAVKTIAAGGEYLQPALGVALARRAASGGTPALSPREREVLRLVALGHTNSEVAAQLHVSRRTVEAQRASVAMKLHCTTRAELVDAAMRLDLL